MIWKRKEITYRILVGEICWKRFSEELENKGKAT
jgi:hypothetical protein